MIKPADPNEIFAKNLVGLRKMQGMSQEELADKTNLSRQTVSKYEKGDADPSISTLTKFSNALGAPLEFFFKENSEFTGFFYGFKILDFSGSMKKISFREAEKLDVETDVIVKKESFEKLRNLLQLEEVMEATTKFKNPIKHLQNINSREKAEEAALEVRKKWGLYDNPFANVISVLEREGVKVIEITAAQSFEGLSAEYFEMPIIILNDAIKEVTRRRFTALHELGHLILQIPGDIDYQKIERICDAFAAMLILPRELLILELGQARTTLSLEELNLIKQKYGISIRAILVSSGFANVISWKKYKEFCEKLSGGIEEVSEYSGKEKATRFDQLLYRGVMERKIDRKKFVELVGDEDAYDKITAV